VITIDKQRPVTLGDISQYFDGYFDPWKRPYSEKPESWYEYRPIKLREDYAIDLISDEPRGTAIDLGCGIGHALIRMKQLGFDRVIGVDVSPKMLAEADRLLQAENMSTSIELYHGDVRDLTMIKSASVDVCTALGVIEYHPADAPMLREVNRVLKRDGVAVLQTRNFYCLNSRTWWVVEQLIPRFRRRIAYREHRPGAFRASLADFGFRAEKECFSAFFALYPLTAIPLVRRAVGPLNNFVSKQCERFRHKGFSTLIAATYMVKVRKISELS
jgi:ubiquinone/menaquinone biosynthesis C-methylase UbiE